MAFKDLLESLRAAAAEGNIDPGLYDELTAAHEDEVSARDGKITELTKANETQLSAAQELEAKMSALKAKNYDLLMAAGSTPPANQGNENGDGDGEDGEDGGPSGIDALFEKKPE